jgi:hypothetical protein
MYNDFVVLLGGIYDLRATNKGIGRLLILQWLKSKAQIYSFERAMDAKRKRGGGHMDSKQCWNKLKCHKIQVCPSTC